MQQDSQIGRYQIVGELGRGGMGVVYKAYDPNLDRPIALKKLDVPSSAGEEDFNRLKRRFILEARIAANLSHPNIIVVYDFAVEQESRSFYITMELLEGETASHAVKTRGAMAWKDVVRIVEQLAPGVGYAHSQGVVHRDLKPSNIMLLADKRVKVLDFGVAKVAEYQMTISGEFVGSPAFCSPEQISGQTMDHRTDLFSIGSMMYYMLSKVKPYKAAKLNDLVLEMVYGDPEPLAQVAPGVPEEVASIVSGLMAKNPQDRYQSIDEFLSALQKIEGGGVKEKAPSGADVQTAYAARSGGSESLSEKKPKLVIQSGPGKGKEFLLKKASTLIGRRNNDFNVPDREISGKHCLLEMGKTSFVLRDLQSKNGTFVEGEQITDATLVPGAVFKIGQSEVRIMLEHGGKPEGGEAAPPVQPEAEAKAKAEAKAEAEAKAKAEAKAEAEAEAEAESKPPADPAATGDAAPVVGLESVTMMDQSSVKLHQDLRKKSAPIVSMRYQLKFIEGPEAGEEIELIEQRSVIGRQDCLVNLNDNLVSRKHAEIEIRGLSTVYLKDLASRNGTFLNDVEISVVQLKNGDEITVGNTRFKFLMHSKS